MGTAIHGVDVDVRVADITSLGEHVSAIVSSDDNLLTHGGGVSAAIWKASGERLVDWWRQSRPGLVLADVVISPAGDLDADHVVHAVTIDFDSGQALRHADAVKLYGSVLDLGADLVWEKLAMPLLGTGAAGLDVGGSAQALIDALRSRRYDVTALRTVVLTINPRLPEGRFAVDELFAAEPEVASPFDGLRELTSPLEMTYAPLADLWDEARADPSPTSAKLMFEAALAAVEARIPADTGPTRGGKPDEVLGAIERGYQRRGHDVPTGLESALYSGLVARNRATHQGLDSPTTRAVRRTLLIAAEVLVANVPQLESGPVGGGAVPLPAEPSVVDPPHMLHYFLLSKLPRTERNDLLESLRKAGYRGSDDACLMEYCLTCSPLDILRDHFTVRQLRIALQGYGVSTPGGGDISKTAEALLQHFGFRSERLPVGIERLAREVHGALTACELMSGAELRGTVGNIATEVEVLVFHFVRFLCRTVLGAEADVWATERAIIKESHTLRKASLGTLLETLDALSSTIRALSGPARLSFERDFGEGTQVPNGYTRLASFRNHFAHADLDGAFAPQSDRAMARDFFELANKLVGRFAEGGDGAEPVYPRVIRVVEVAIDEWNRRIVTAVDDEGRHERIFTEQELLPGRVYLMRPISNPLRVDPILMPLGDAPEPAVN